MYEIRFLDSAEQSLRKLDRSVARRILARLTRLGNNFEQIKPVALAGDLSGFYKLRVGDYRVVYQPLHDERVLFVHMIGHRRDVYRS